MSSDLQAHQLAREIAREILRELALARIRPIIERIVREQFDHKMRLRRIRTLGDITPKDAR